MKKVAFTLLFLAGATMATNSFSQTKTGQIYFIRSNGYVGSLVNNKVYIDDNLVCKLKNHQYSVHEVSVGDHTVAADDSGLSVQEKSEPFTVHVEDGKITYVDVVWADKVSCQEITKGSAEVKLQKVKLNKKCLSGK